MKATRVGSAVRDAVVTGICCSGGCIVEDALNLSRFSVRNV